MVLVPVAFFMTVEKDRFIDAPSINWFWLSLSYVWTFLPGLNSRDGPLHEPLEQLHKMHPLSIFEARGCGTQLLHLQKV
jgi:hypothetical protein